MRLAAAPSGLEAVRPAVLGRAGWSAVATFEEEDAAKAAASATGSLAPSQVVVHFALLCGQAINGSAAVVGKVALPTVNPVFFALLRDACATPLLAILARRLDGPHSMQWQEFPLSQLMLASFALFSNQLAMVTGLKLANPVVCSAWQPSQPVFVLVMAVALRQEACTALKTLGVLAALLGGAVMTAGSTRVVGDGGSLRETAVTNFEVTANALFFYNCSMTAVFVLAMRSIARRMPAYTGLAAAYAGATLGILLTARLVSINPKLRSFFCPDCREGFWQLPTGCLFALAYWVVGSSVLAYMCLTYGAKHARDATHCLAYTAVQPVAAGLLEAVLIASGWNAANTGTVLELPGKVQVLGAGIVVLGVAFVVADAKRGASADGQQAAVRSVSLELAAGGVVVSGGPKPPGSGGAPSPGGAPA